MRAFATDRWRLARWAPFLVVIALLPLAGGPPAHAQPTPTNPTAPPRAAISIAQIPAAAEDTDNELRAMRARIGADADIQSIRADLPGLATQIQELGRSATAQIAAGITPPGMQDLERQWRQRKEQLTSWAQLLAARVQAVEQDTARLTELEDTWAQTAAAAQENNLTNVVGDPIRTARTGIRETQTQLRGQRDSLLAAATRVASLQAEVTEGLAQLELAEQRLRRDLFNIDGPPLWVALGELSYAFPAAEALRTGFEHDLDLLRAFFHQQRGRVAAHAVLVLIILAVMLSLSRRQRDALPDDAPAAVRTVLARPISATLLLAALLNFLLYPYAPIILIDVVSLIVAVVMVRLFRAEAEWAVRGFVLLLSTLFLISALRRLLPLFSPAARTLVLAQDLIAAGWLWSTLRSARFATSTFAQHWGRSGRVLAWSVVALLALAVGGNGIGNIWLAIVLTDGALRSAFAALGLLAADRVIEGLVIEIFSSHSWVPARSIATHAATLRWHTVRLVRTLLALLWLVLTLDFVAFLAPVAEAARTILAAELQVGAVTLSLAGVLTVAFTVWVSILIARIVRVVLEEDVLTRLSLPRGVPAAISAGANYLVLLIGFLVALSAAGIDPGRVALVAGALSVGIGFGLGTVVGQVRRIGIRSSTIATFDGADVIVPNATLISERVVNWTLSNRQRRIEITVGVAYGSEPTKVIEVLENAARETTDILAYPEPQAVFVAFGDSSLNFALRVWTNRQDILGLVRSRVAVAMYDALAAAGMAIPFPQQDVHVKITEPAPPKPSG